MSLEKPEQISTIKDKYLSKIDKEGFVSVGDFAVSELHRQSKSVAALLDGEEGTELESNLGNGLRYLGQSGNYPDMKIHIDDLQTFIERVNKYFGEIKN